MGVQRQTARVGRDITAEDRRTAVLRAALHCVAQTGSVNVRLRDVSRAAGVSVGSLQHYFDSRDDLLAQAFRQASEDLLSRWDRILDEESSAWDRFVAVVDGLTSRESLRARCLIWVDFGTAAARLEEVAREFEGVYQRWVQIFDDAVREGVAQGDFAPRLENGEVVRLLLQQLDGGIFHIASGVGDEDGAQLRTASLRLAALLVGHGSAGSS